MAALAAAVWFTVHRGLRVDELRSDLLTTVSHEMKTPLAAIDGAKGLPTNKALPLVLVCASGARSSRAAAQLRKAGYSSVHSLSGGTEAWRNASLPIEKSA